MSQLQVFLDRLFIKYHRAEFLSSDPLEFPRQYRDPLDQEAVALLSALLAYGNVKQIRRSVAGALSRMEKSRRSPRLFVESLGRGDAASLAQALRAFEGYVHRFNSGEDLVLLFSLLGRSWKKHGSLGSHFLGYLRPEDRNISGALDLLIQSWRKEVEAVPELRELRRRSPSFDYLLTAPEAGSCCKRWCMFLRWVGRKDSLDLGLWTDQSQLAATFPRGRFLRPDQLVIPIDTHTGRISRYIGLTQRKSLNWLAAVEVTDSLRECDGEDPTRYDFALARLGILDVCQLKYREEVCRECDLVTVCRFAKAGQARAERASRAKARKKPLSRSKNP